MNRVLVTGANGFVGGHLVKELHEHNIEVVGIGGAHGSSPKPQYVDKYLQVDLMDPAEVAAIDLHPIEGIIHLAGLAVAGASFDNPLGYITTNIGIETNLFELALKQGVRPRFLAISTGTLYDPKAPLPLTEKSAVIPSSPYAVSKLGQEQMAQYYQMRGFDCVIARPFNHIGPGQNLGFIVPDLIKQVIDYEQGKATEVLAGNLDAKRDYTDVRDIVRAYRLLLEHGKDGEIYNICSGNSISGHEILELIIDETHTTPPVRQDPSRMRPSDTPVLFGDHTKITADTGWQPAIFLKDTIRDTVEDWHNR